MTIRPYVFIALLAISLASANADDGAMARCASIGSPLDRLECYDALARSMKAVPPLPTVAAPATAPSPATAVADTPMPKPAPTPVTRVTDADDEDFGFEARRIEETPDEFSARYDGDFSGWSGQTLFKLENGQVWKQSQQGRVSFRRSRPMITIRKGSFGSFRLSVEGLNKTVRVKRIK